MNKAKRKQLTQIIEELKKTSGTKKEIEYLIMKIEDVLYEEQYDYNNLSEGFKAASRGVAMDDAIDEMDDACRSLKRAIKQPDKAKNEIEYAIKCLLCAQM